MTSISAAFREEAETRLLARRIGAGAMDVMRGQAADLSSTRERVRHD
jgi:hypothetical protein